MHIFHLKNHPVIAHIKNTDLKENPKEKRPDCSGTIERDILKKVEYWHIVYNNLTFASIPKWEENKIVFICLKPKL